MELSAGLKKVYTEEQQSAREAQRYAQIIAWGPVVFQTARVMVKWGILELINQSENGLTREEICEETGLSDYAVKCLLEASLCIGIIVVNPETDRFSITKAGWFLMNDRSTRVNMDLNHDVNYQGMFYLDEALKEGRPEGLKTIGDWPTLYEGLSSFPPQVKESWLNFDHYYSDESFEEALKIVFDTYQVKRLYDVGGNTGKWALQCVGYSDTAEVTSLDLPQQIRMMQENTAGKKGAERIKGFPINLLDEQAAFPQQEGLDAIWMSQFLDCFSMEQIVSILKRAQAVMTADSRIFIMETLWDRQRFDTAAFCLTMTSLYFTAMANGNSKMYNTKDMELCIREAGLEIEQLYDHLGLGHTILVAKKAE